MHDRHSALAFAKAAHANQFGDDGKPHFEHVLSVVSNVETLIAGLPDGMLAPEEVDEILQAAALHDCPEDQEFTGVSHDDLETAGFPADVRRRVRRLDKRFKVGTYQQNMEAIASEGDVGVLVIKLGDNIDNGSPERLAGLPPEKRSIEKRYAKARVVLQAAYDALARETAPSPPSR